MKKRRIVFLAIFAVLSYSLVFAETAAKRSAEIIGLSGNVLVKESKDKNWVIAKKGMVIYEGAVIKTEAGSSSRLSIDGKKRSAVVDIEENSQLLLAELIEDAQKQSQRTLLDLAIGKVLIKANKLNNDKSKFEVKTPTSIVGVRGTVFTVEVEAIE